MNPCIGCVLVQEDCNAGTQTNMFSSKPNQLRILASTALLVLFFGGCMHQGQRLQPLTNGTCCWQVSIRNATATIRPAGRAGRRSARCAFLLMEWCRWVDQTELVDPSRLDVPPQPRRPKNSTHALTDDSERQRPWFQKPVPLRCGWTGRCSRLRHPATSRSEECSGRILAERRPGHRSSRRPVMRLKPPMEPSCRIEERRDAGAFRANIAPAILQ